MSLMPFDRYLVFFLSIFILLAKRQKQRSIVKAGEAHGIEVNYEDGILEISMPRLLPKRKGRQSSLFLTDPLSEIRYVLHPFFPPGNPRRKAPFLHDIDACAVSVPQLCKSPR